MDDFKTKCVIVTGGAGGIGKATCKEFAKHNANVLCIDNDDARINNFQSNNELKNISFFKLDITEEDEVKNFYNEINTKFKGVDHLVNNAGVATLNLCKDLSVEEWDLVMRVNLRGMFLMTKYAIPIFNDNGSILNISSQAARRAQRFTSHYNASKMGVIGFTRAIALELAPKIRVNAIAPGPIPTENFKDSMNMHTEERERELKKYIPIPLNRWGSPEDIGAAVVFMASNASSWVTGQCLFVDGGT